MVGSYLASTTSSDDVSIPYCSFYNHNGIMQTSFHLSNELFSASSQNQSAGFCCRTSLEEIESFAPYLSLLEPLASAQMLWLDVRAC